MMQAIKRMGATNFFENIVKSKPRLNKLKCMYIIRKEISDHGKTK